MLRVLGPSGAGRFSIVVGAVDFLALLVWLTSDDALVKYGFRYSAAGDWGRFHRLVRLAFTCEVVASLAASALIAAIAPFTGSIFRHGGAGLTTPMLIAALLPPLQAFESMARPRPDPPRPLRPAGDLAHALDGPAPGGDRDRRPLGRDRGRARRRLRPGADDDLDPRARPQAASGSSPPPTGCRWPTTAQPIIRFVAQSAAYTGLISLRTWIAPLTLGIVRNTTAVGLFRGAQAPRDRVRGALLAAADDPAHRADARLGERPAGARARRDPPLHDRGELLSPWSRSGRRCG